MRTEGPQTIPNQGFTPRTYFCKGQIPDFRKANYSLQRAHRFLILWKIEGGAWEACPRSFIEKIFFPPVGPNSFGFIIITFLSSALQSPEIFAHEVLSLFTPMRHFTHGGRPPDIPEILYQLGRFNNRVCTLRAALEAEKPDHKSSNVHVITLYWRFGKLQVP